MLGVEVLELRRVGDSGTNERRRIHTVLILRKNAGTTAVDDQIRQTTRRTLRGQDARWSLRPAYLFGGVGLLRPSMPFSKETEDSSGMSVENHYSDKPAAKANPFLR